MTNTITTADLRVELKNRIASLDMEICEKKYEVTRLQDEIDDLEIEHSDLLSNLAELEDVKD
jgi:hypothetical protein